MKKVLISMVIFILMFNYIFTQIVFAETETSDSTAGDTTGAVYTGFDDANNSGVSIGPDNQTYSNNLASSPSTAGGTSGTIAKALNVIPLLLNAVTNYVANEAGFIDFYINMPNSQITEDDFKYMTIEKIVFGKYYFFNVDVFKDSEILQVTDKDGNEPDLNGLTGTLDELRDEISKWYYIMRLLSLVIGLITLIYIGIRMAISTAAEDQARYKKMLIGWVQSILIIVILPYIMMLLNFTAKILMDIINSLRNNLILNKQSSFENAIIEMVYGDLAKAGGFNLVSKVIIFSILVWAEFKFFMMYIKRLLAVSFLTIISPLITITYSIDKAGDGRAQAFGGWFREYMMNILIQPLQAILYLIFVFSANAIAVEAPAVGIIFLLSLTRAEKIFKTIFNMRGLVSMNTMRFFKKDK